MIKRIAVPTDGSEAAEIGVRYAVKLASNFKASLHGIFVIDVKLLEGPFLRDISASLGTAPYVNYQGNIAMILEERGKAALQSFEKNCEEAGVECDTVLATGVVPRAILENSDLADLLVMGQGGEHNELLEGLMGSTTEAVIRRAGLPVIVTATDRVLEKRFMVAYDGGPQAKKALKYAVALSEDWNLPFDLLVVGGDEMEGVLEDAQEYLQAHKREVQYVRREGDPKEIIINYAEECDAALLVMGAYGHSKFRELFVGSTTTHAINHAQCPVLLAQ